MKYFFLTEGWAIARVWSEHGLWDSIALRRQPSIQALNLYLQDHGARLQLYRVEAAISMVEVRPNQDPVNTAPQIGQVLIRRWLNGNEVIDHLCLPPEELEPEELEPQNLEPQNLEPQNLVNPTTSRLETVQSL